MVLKEGDTVADSDLLKTVIDLLQAMEEGTKKIMPEEIAEIVKFHAKGAAVSALGSAWIPGVGGTAAVAISAGFIWSMYGRINKKLGLPLSENILKTLASGVATNLAAAAIASIAVSTALSIVPGIGWLGASAIMGGVCYALTLGSGFVYLKILTRLFRAGKKPEEMTADDLKKVAKDVVDQENIKDVMKNAKKEFKSARARGEIKK